MTVYSKLLFQVLRGSSDANVPFDGLCNLLLRAGFDMRIRGSHHMFSKDGLPEILNLQPRGANAKPYQVKQVRTILLKYNLIGDLHD